MNTSGITPTIDLKAAARLLVEWMDDPKMGPHEIGWPLELWLTLLGLDRDPDSPDYGLDDAVEYAFHLAHSDDRPSPGPGGRPMVTVEVIKGEVL